MTLKELILKYNQKTILNRLVELYPNQKKNLKGYINVLKELSNLKPKSNELKINLYKNYDKFDKEYYIHVEGIDKNKQTWAIEFVNWNEWLGMKIELKTLKKYNLLDIVCYCLWEMTFCGFSQKKIEEERNELKRRIDSIKEEDLETEE